MKTDSYLQRDMCVKADKLFSSVFVFLDARIYIRLASIQRLDGSRCFLLERCNGRDSPYIHVVTCHTENDSDEFDAIHFKVKFFSHVIGLSTRDYHCHVGCFRSNVTLCGTRN